MLDAEVLVTSILLVTRLRVHGPFECLSPSSLIEHLGRVLCAPPPEADILRTKRRASEQGETVEILHFPY